MSGSRTGFAEYSNLMKIYVVNIKEQTERLESFRERWRGWEYERLDGVVEEIRGLGITKTYIKALERIDTEWTMFLEDDTAPFCSRREIEDQLTPDTRLLLLGAHHISAEQPSRRTPVYRASGSYGWVIHRSFVPALLDCWKKHISTERKSYDPDMAWCSLFDVDGVYLSSPLAVDHLNGWSNTWQMWRNDKWSGKREWWLQECNVVFTGQELWPNGTRFGFGKTQRGRQFLRNGWSQPEPEFVWSVRRQSKLAFRTFMGFTIGIRVVMKIRPYVPAGCGSAILDLIVQNISLRQWTFSLPNPAPQIIEAFVPAGLVGADGEVELLLDFDRPRCPAQYAGTNDNRTLGICLYWMEVHDE